MKSLTVMLMVPALYGQQSLVEQHIQKRVEFCASVTEFFKGASDGTLVMFTLTTPDSKLRDVAYLALHSKTKRFTESENQQILEKFGNPLRNLGFTELVLLQPSGKRADNMTFTVKGTRWMVYASHRL